MISQEEENITDELESDNRRTHPALLNKKNSPRHLIINTDKKPRKTQPYKSVIDKIKELRTVRNPLKKLLVIFDAK